MEEEILESWKKFQLIEAKQLLLNEDLINPTYISRQEDLLILGLMATEKLVNKEALNHHVFHLEVKGQSEFQRSRAKYLCGQIPKIE